MTHIGTNDPLQFTNGTRSLSTKASGRNRFTRDIASPRESDLRQVGLRRQICPQICFPWHGSVARGRSTLRLADGKFFPAAHDSEWTRQSRRLLGPNMGQL